jgi:hypothetical protein
MRNRRGRRNGNKDNEEVGDEGVFRKKLGAD